MNQTKKTSVLFICMGNICRSPAAEGIMKKKISENGFADKIFADSAGTIGYHTGESPDERMQAFAKKRGYNLEHKARRFNPNSDFEKFDYILTMDDDNYFEITRLDADKKYKDKIFRITDFQKDEDITEVPDPYYGGSAGFEKVLNILEASIDGFIKKEFQLDY